MRARIGPFAVLMHNRLDKGVATYAMSVVNAFKDNPYYPSPDPGLDVVMEHIAVLVAMETGPRGSATAAQLRAKRLVVMQCLRQLKEHVQRTIEKETSAADAVAMIESVHMRVKGYTKPFKPELAATNRSPLGDVLLRAKAARGRASYHWQYSVNGVDWIDLPETLQASTIVSGLTVAQTYRFRFRALTRTGMGDYSQAVSLMVA